ncbi:MAG: M20 family metallopeptidase [Actinomycetota bacterium]
MPATVIDDARTVQERVVALRRQLHRHPELGLHLPLTQSAVLDELADLDLDVRTGFSTSSIVADLTGGRPGPTVLLRGDMDALPMPEDTGLEFASTLPDRMHACGHDAHTAMLAGAARVLAGRRDELAGRVRFMFQPGEEGFGGAVHMIDEGVVDGVDHAYALHVSPNLPAGWIGTRGGSLMASADTFTVEVVGQGGHASMPHYAVDPVPVACEIVTAIQSFVTRRVDVFDPTVVTVARIEAGTTSNVIAERAVLEGTIRAVSEGSRESAQSAVERLARNIAAAHECEAVVSIDEGYPVTVNDHASARHVLDLAGEVVGDRARVELPSPVMGAEDFSYVLQRVPGAMSFLGVCPPGMDPAQAPACHSNRMLLDEDAMAAGVAMLVALATRPSPNPAGDA